MADLLQNKLLRSQYLQDIIIDLKTKSDGNERSQSHRANPVRNP